MEETVVSSAAPEAGGGDAFDAALDASLSKPDTDASSDTDTSAETADAPPELETPEQPTETAEETPEAEAAPQAQQPEEEIDPAEPIEADRVTDGGKTLHFRAAKAKVLMADHDFANQVRTVVPNATVEGIKDAFERVVGLDEFIDDFESGSPERVARAADWFMGENANPQSVEAFADHIVRTVAQKQPQVYGKIARNVLGGWVQKLYDDAVRSNDESKLVFAQHADMQLRGRFIKKTEFEQRDPYADREADLSRREQALQQQRDTDRQRFVEAQVNATLTKQDTEINGLVEKALSLIPENVKQMRALEFKHAVRDLRDAIEEAKKANPLFVRQYENQLKKVRSNPTEEAKDTLVTMMRNFAERAIGAQRKAVLARFNEAVKGASANAHKKLAETAARREPVGSNTPVQRPGASQKLKGMKSYDEAFKAVFG